MGLAGKNYGGDNSIMHSDYMDWRTRSKCAQLSPNEYDTLFFPLAGRSINKAKSFCSDCPVIKECLEYALTSGEHGIWGGTNEKEREDIRGFQRAALPKPRKIIAKKNFTFA